MMQEGKMTHSSRRICMVFSLFISLICTVKCINQQHIRFNKQYLQSKVPSVIRHQYIVHGLPDGEIKRPTKSMSFDAEAPQTVALNRNKISAIADWPYLRQKRLSLDEKPQPPGYRPSKDNFNPSQRVPG